MVSLSSVSGSGGSLYLEIRRIELLGVHSDISYQLNGMVGDGCDEALIRVELDSSPRVEIVPICNEDGSGGTLDERIGFCDLQKLIIDALTHVYFCLEPVFGEQSSAQVTGYVDGGRMIRLPDAVAPDDIIHQVAEEEPFWHAA